MKNYFRILFFAFLFVLVVFSVITVVEAAAPDPGHNFTEVSGGIAQGDVLYGSVADTFLVLAKNTTATRYVANTGTTNNPAWAQVDLTNGVTGVLPAANGGGKGYTLSVQALTSNPADTTLRYFGQEPSVPGAVSTSRVYIRKAGTITMANIYSQSTTAGTAENWSLYIRVNNTTDYLIATVGVSAAERIFSNSSLSIAMSAGDYFEIKSIPPVWATNPLGTVFDGYVYIE